MRVLRMLWIPAALAASSAFAQPTDVWLKRANFTSGSGDKVLASQKVGVDSLVVVSARWATTNPDPAGGFVTFTRYNAAGAVTWTRDYFIPGGAGAYQAQLGVNPAGDLVAVIDPNSSGIGSVSTDVVVQKFRGVDGAPVWTKLLDTIDNYFGSTILGVAFDPSNNVLIGGGSYLNNEQVFRIVKLNGTSASQMWVANGKSNGYDYYTATGFAVDSQGNPAMTGTMRPGLCSTNDEYRAVTMRFSGVNGSKTWERTYNKAGKGDSGADLVFDSTNALLVAINSRGTDNKINPTVIKYAGANGNEAWTKSITPTGSDIWTIDDIELGPSNSAYITGEKNTSTIDSVYVGKFASNGGQQFVQIFPTTVTKPLTTEPRQLQIDAAGNAVVGMIESNTDFSNPSNPFMYFAKMNGATGSQIWYRRAGVSGFAVPSIRGFHLFANGAFNVAASNGAKIAVLRYNNNIPSLPTWTVKPTAATVAREDGMNHFVQNPAGDIFVAGSTAGRWVFSKYTSAGVRSFAIPYSRNNLLTTYSSDQPRQIALAPDGNILIAGQSIFDEMVVKFNATTGAKMWESVSGSWGFGSEPSVMVVHADGIYVVQNGSKAGVRKLNLDGTTAWSTVWEAAPDYAIGTMISIDAEGNPILGGYVTTNTSCGQTPNQRIFAAEFNKTSGAVTWSYVNTPVATGYHDLRGIQVAPNGSIFLASTMPGTAPVSDRSCVTKLTAAGVQQFQAFYQPAGHGDSNGLSLTLDGNDPIISQTTSPATGLGIETVVIRYNGTSGAQTYATKDSGTNLSKIRPYSLFANSSGVYVFGWRFHPTTANCEAVIFKLSVSGVRQWTYTYAGTANGANDVNWAAKSVSNTNIIWVGNGTGTNSGFDQVIGRITNP